MIKFQPKNLSFLGTISAAALALWPATAAAQNVSTIECDGDTLSSPPGYADVIIKGGSCTLDGATVFGSVINDGGGDLTTTVNGANVFGSVQAKSAGNVALNNVSVSGDVQMENSGDLTIKGISSVGTVSIKDSGKVKILSDASTGEVKVEKSGNVIVSGTVASVFSLESGKVILKNGSRTFPGGVEMIGGLNLKICGVIGISAEGTDGSGGVSVKDNSGHVQAVFVAGTCEPEIEGSVIVEKGTGNVEFVGVTLAAGDFVVIERTGGNVLLDGATVSDVKIEKSTENIKLIGVTTDSDTSIVDNGGNVTIEMSRLGSDAEIKLNGTVAIMDTSFSLEDVSVSNNGDVVIDSNCDMRLTVTENGNVMIINNNPTDAGAMCTSGFGFTDADVSKNEDVTINNNTGESLVCSDNASVGGGGNIITFTDGQCTGF